VFGRVVEIGSLTDALAILTSMITPALLISACGTLILSTSSRLGRVVDRIRKLSDRMEELATADEQLLLLDERRAFIFNQIDTLTRRAHVLQRAMALLYVSVCSFVSTSVAIGLIGVSVTTAGWAPVALGLGGVGLLFVVSIMLIFEARLARASLSVELDFLIRLGQEHAPSVERRPRRWSARRKRTQASAPR
jgi:hypothetical protein